MSRILVIDDDGMILRMTEFMLKKQGHEAVTAASGSEGLDKLRSQGADLVLLDVEMPEMSGMEVLEAIRSDSELSAVKVCLMTGTVTPQTDEAVNSQKACACIGKPIKAEELFAVLDAEI